MVVSASTVVFVVALLGGAAQAVVTLRWYVPPKTSDEEPGVWFEAGFFFAVFGVFFVLLGTVLSAVAGFAPPSSALALLVLVPVGGFVAYAAFTGRLDHRGDRTQTRMFGVCGLVLAVYPIALLLV